MVDQQYNFIFSKKNYQLVILGILFIGIGFLLMIGGQANTNSNGFFDPNYWNPDIFSFTRVHLAPSFILFGYLIEVFAIFYKENKSS